MKRLLETIARQTHFPVQFAHKMRLYTLISANGKEYVVQTQKTAGISAGLHENVFVRQKTAKYGKSGEDMQR
ncbi:hypothetical protein NAI64_02575 [Oxalobacter sp. OxGP1]|uniref:hypothetical protein n=1 Tax=Oxalobacter paeniformigenes TaxID=2946594 RepID=UPI0022AE8F73|nr:hypothetical protein [Oxalobacter paeniformigenes]MCZ4052608.1 hypothetical protein [Oxalobacter paeniformigenes]